MWRASRGSQTNTEEDCVQDGAVSLALLSVPPSAFLSVCLSSVSHCVIECGQSECCSCLCFPVSLLMLLVLAVSVSYCYIECEQIECSYGAARVSVSQSSCWCCLFLWVWAKRAVLILLLSYWLAVFVRACQSVCLSVCVYPSVVLLFGLPLSLSLACSSCVPSAWPPDFLHLDLYTPETYTKRHLQLHVHKWFAHSSDVVGVCVLYPCLFNRLAFVSFSLYRVKCGLLLCAVWPRIINFYGL